jgi:Uma2 family endonuclease
MQTLEPAVQRYVFHDVTWDYYTRTLREIQNRRLQARVTFDQGEMEIMTLGDRHEAIKSAIARLLETYALETDHPISCAGSATCRREDLQRGLEPDECYYVSKPRPPMAPAGEPLDLSVYPPPELAIEVDITRVSISKQPIYAALGVREVWRYDGAILRPMTLTPSGQYRVIERSELLPALSMQEFNRCIQIALNESHHAGAKAIREWARQQGRG